MEHFATPHLPGPGCRHLLDRARQIDPSSQALKPLIGCCQTNANRSQLADGDEVSGHAQPPPLGKSGGAVLLKIVPAVEVAFLIEVVMDGGVNGSELLQTSHASETQHRSFSSSQRKM
jgi:hypothetical protein